VTTTSQSTAADKPRSRRDTTRFLAEALRTPRQIGAVAPSGPRLAAQAAGLLTDHGEPQVVVELGPGNGVISDALRARLPSGSTLTAVEINAAMVTHLSQTRPWLNVIHGDAANLGHLLHAAGLAPADLIVSALPWSLLPDFAQRRVLAAIAGSLDPRGTFATITTIPVRPLPAIRRFLHHLDRTFASVTRTPTVWRNMPPAYFYVCRHPLIAGLGQAPSGQRTSGKAPSANA
jgi:phosphatidylethanolamine/phosphatidyl-N-methylethanolamine N-methyltransferase